MSQPLRLPPRLTVPGLLAVVLLSGCAMFSQSPDAEVRQMVADGAPAGRSIDAAEAAISEHGYACTDAHGSFIDNDGNEHSPDKFVHCVEKPGRFAFNCAYRNHVYLVPKGGVVDEAYVVRGPNCLDQ